MKRFAVILICGFSVSGSTVVSADEPPPPTEKTPARGRMFIPFSRIVHNNRPCCQRLATWMCYRTPRVPRDAKLLYLRPIPAEQPPIYTYFAWMDGNGACAGCRPAAAHAAPALHLAAPVDE